MKEFVVSLPNSKVKVANRVEMKKLRIEPGDLRKKMASTVERREDRGEVEVQNEVRSPHRKKYFVLINNLKYRFLYHFKEILFMFHKKSVLNLLSVAFNASEKSA